jgi:hypothetical protein
MNNNENQFRSWAVVEVMGHVEYAGFVAAETIAGVHMLRIDVPATTDRAGFTKYIAPGALYGISPCSEETARMRAEANRSTPFASWSIESQVLSALEKSGRLLPAKSSSDDDPDDHPF